MNEEELRGIAAERALSKAKEAVHARLALASAAIWILGVFFVHLFSPEHAQDRLASLATVGLLLPAALVWLARPYLVRVEANRRTGEEYAAMSRARGATKGAVLTGTG